jgi:hypothetical protein
MTAITNNTLGAGDMVASIQKDGSYRADFASLDAFVKYLDSTPPTASKVKTSREMHRKHWFMSDNWEHASRLVREGWQEGREALAQAKALVPVVQARGRVLAQGMDVAGAYPVVPLAVAGDPCCMVTVGEQERATRPYVRFSISACVSGGIGADVIQARGAAILAWIDALEDAGARCEVVMQFKLGTEKRDRADCTVMVKRAEEPLNLDVLAYALCNASFFRRHGFGWFERVPGNPADRVGTSYGIVDDVKIDEPNVVLFGSQTLGEVQWDNPAAATKYVQGQIRKHCGDLGGMLDAA